MYMEKPLLSVVTALYGLSLASKGWSALYYLITSYPINTTSAAKMIMIVIIVSEVVIR